MSQARYCAPAHPLKSAPDAGRGRHPGQIREFAAPGASDVLAAEWSARQVVRRSLHGRASLPRRSPHPAPALAAAALAPASPRFFRRCAGAEENFQLPPVGRGRLFQQAIRIRTQGFVVHFALCPCSASSARLSSTIFTTGCPRKRASGLCVYSATSCATCSTGSWRAAATRGICHAAAPGVRLLSSPLAEAVASSTGTAELAWGLAARSAATRDCICASSSGLLAARLLPPDASGL